MRGGARYRKRRATPLAAKSARPTRVGHIGPPGVLRRLPDVLASRRAPRLPGGPMCPMKRVNINDLWYHLRQCLVHRGPLMSGTGGDKESLTSIVGRVPPLEAGAGEEG